MKIGIQAVIHSVLAIIVSFLLCMMLSLFILNETIPENIAVYLVSVAVAVGYFAAELVFKKESQSVLQGCITVAVQFIMLFLLKQIFFRDCEPNYRITLIPLFIAGGIGCFAHRKPKEHTRHAPKGKSYLHRR